MAGFALGAGRYGAMLGMALAAASVSARPGQSASPAAASQAAAPDVIVRGVPNGPFPVETKPLAGYPQLAFNGRQAAGDAELFARCITDRRRDRRQLRRLIDTPPTNFGRADALDHLVQDNLACYPGASTLSIATPGYFGNCNPRGDYRPASSLGGTITILADGAVCQAFFDRGAIIQRVIALYAPGLSFTTDQLNDRRIVARFQSRERRLDKGRSKRERLFALVVGCLVEGQPEIALGYLRSGVASPDEPKLRSALIGLTPACVGGAQSVEVDPSQFRVLVADAVYSWAVAVRGADSLIPDP